ncbi:MAG: Enoyl-CoA hydratase, partial [uncultured Thermomicrobiales bacterium]
PTARSPSGPRSGRSRSRAPVCPHRGWRKRRGPSPMSLRNRSSGKGWRPSSRNARRTSGVARH